MEFFLSIIFLGLHLLNYQRPLPKALFFVAGLLLFCALFYACYKKSQNFFCTCLMMFCHTWQASWVNIFGDVGSPLQITWFYIIGLIILVYVFFDIKNLLGKKVPTVPLAIFAVTFVFMLYPQLISPSQSQGIKELLMIAFFLVMGFVAFLYKDEVTSEKRKFVVNSYIFCIVVTCILLLFQYAVYYFFKRPIFRYSVGVYNGKALTSSKLLMDDTSCSAIMIGAAAFYLLERINKRNWFIVLALSAVIFAGMGTTTRRTAIVTLAITLIIYVIFHFRGVVKKIVMSLAAVGLMGVMFQYLYYTRYITGVDSLLYDNGRLSIYYRSLQLFLKYPLGMGYDNAHLAYEMGGIIPHSTILRWMNMGGIIFAVLMIAVIGYFFVISCKKTIKTEMWFILYCIIGSNLIPDILNARLFVLPVMMAFLFQNPEENSSNEENIAVQSRNEL